MDIKTMSVTVADRSIAINGEGYICAPEYFPAIDPNVIALQWHPEARGKCKGSVSCHEGGGHGLNEFTLFEPFVPAWQEAKVRKEARVALEQAEAQGAFAPPADPNVVPIPDELGRVELPADDMHRRADAFDSRVRETVDLVKRDLAQAHAPDKQRIDGLEAKIEVLAQGLATGLADLRRELIDAMQRIAGEKK